MHVFHLNIHRHVLRLNIHRHVLCLNIYMHVFHLNVDMHVLHLNINRHVLHSNISSRYVITNPLCCHSNVPLLWFYYQKQSGQYLNGRSWNKLYSPKISSVIWA